MSEIESLNFSTILASTIHDVKNSLGIVLNSLDELILTVGAALPADQLVKLRYESQRVNDNLVQLLALYKMENRELTANIDEYPVRGFFAEIALSEKAALEARDIKLECRCAGDTLWYFDRELLRGVLKNAINNAARYTKNILLVTAEERQGYLVMSVNDNGPGFPESMLVAGEHQGHGINFSSGNTGLGLYFTSKVAEMHRNKGKKGRIELANGYLLGGGCFSIMLP
jgi:signal transduction histidine kinase